MSFTPWGAQRPEDPFLSSQSNDTPPSHSPTDTNLRPTSPGENPPTQPKKGSGIYSAIYSGVPVYEMMVVDIPVMRRMSDSYLNATQILKVAGYDKHSRTKILDRTIGLDHEKIQGGYGKFQGTWIPLEEGRHLAERYNVKQQLQPLLDFEPQAGSTKSKPRRGSSGLPDDGSSQSRQPQAPPRIKPKVRRRPPPTGNDPPPPSFSWEEAAEHFASRIGVKNTIGPDGQPVNLAAQMDHLLNTLGVHPPALPNVPITVTAPERILSSDPALVPEIPSAQNFTPLASQPAAGNEEALPNPLESTAQDPVAAQNYIKTIQALLNTQDLPDSLAASVAGPAVSVPPSVQSTYQQLAMWNLIGLAFQHAQSTGGVPPPPGSQNLLATPNPQTLTHGAPAASEPNADFLEDFGMENGIADHGAQPSPSRRSQASSAPRSRHPTDQRKAKAKPVEEIVEETPEAKARRELVQQRQQEVLSNMYLFSDSQIPKIIASMRPYVNSKKIDVNMVVDARRRSTLLHFASALGRSKLVDALITAGANTGIVAEGGETPLMRAVYYLGCYESQTFNQIADALSDTVHIVDVNKRTALHHAARAARRRDLFSAGAYYARQLVNVLEVVYADAPSLVPQVVNAQDIHGNTALHYACRTGNYQLARILLAVGGAHDLSNANNETPNDLARSDPRVLALLYRTPDCVEPSREEREAALSEYDYEQENGGCPDEDAEDVFLDMEEGLESEDHDSEYDDLERPPNGRPGARDLHEQTMAQLDAFYGGRVEKILATLQPSVTGMVRAGVEAIRKRLLDHYRLTETLLQPKGNAYVAARQQLDHSRQDFSELMGARARMQTLCDIADELSERVDKRVADRAAVLAAAAQEAETRQAAEALADVMELTTDDANTRKRNASSKADQDDEPASKVRRFSVTSNTAPGPAAFSTPPRGSASTTLQDEIVLTPPPPFFMGSHREQSVNLVRELIQLQQAVARAERARKAVQKDLANIRASRKSKDDKFRRIIAACVQCPLEAVDELIAPLVGITDESHDSLIVV